MAVFPRVDADGKDQAVGDEDLGIFNEKDVDLVVVGNADKDLARSVDCHESYFQSLAMPPTNYHSHLQRSRYLADHGKLCSTLTN